MTIKVKYPGILENYGIAYDTTLEIPENSTLATFLESRITKPEHLGGHILMINGQIVSADRTLQPGDVLSLFYPALGG